MVTAVTAQKSVHLEDVLKGTNCALCAWESSGRVPFSILIGINSDESIAILLSWSFRGYNQRG